MNCQGCGHNYPNTLTRCPRCKSASNRRGQRASDSRLIEFPKKTRAAHQDEQPDASLPAWRVELNEKVRAIQARRNNPALQTSKADGVQANVADAELSAGAVAVRQTELRAKGRAVPARAVHSLAADQLKQAPARLDLETS